VSEKSLVIGMIRAPALHFLALGALLFAAVSLRAGPEPIALRAPIVITAERVAEIRDDYRRTMGSPPTSRELDALLAKEADDEMLYREALLLGIDRGDPAVEFRVIEKMEFLYGKPPDGDAGALRRGLELGLQRDDVVVRSGLVTKMRLLAKGASRADEPTGDALDQELAAYLEGHRTDYVQPGRISLAHVFLRGDATREPEARALRARLEAAGTPPLEAAREGDPFVAGGALRETTQSGLAKLFGEQFANDVSSLTPGRWSEPIRSPYGIHLVWVLEAAEPHLPKLEEVRSRVLQAWRAEREKRYLERMLAEIRAAYEVRVEGEAAQNG
jgi:hypothetical protein